MKADYQKNKNRPTFKENKFRSKDNKNDFAKNSIDKNLNSIKKETL
jgi:hypothetical protein